MVSYVDEKTGSPVEGITYDSSPLSNCSIDWISLSQSLTNGLPMQTDVIHHQSRTDLDCPCMQYF